MIPLTPSFVIAAANAFVGLGEEGGDNRGQMVELFLRAVQQPPGQPWCAAFVHHVGFCAHYDSRARRSSWSLPPTASCQELHDYAEPRGAVVTVPAEGDVFLVWRPAMRKFGHTGFVVSIDVVMPGAAGPLYRCTTVEGNTNDDGSANGYTTLRRTRTFTGADRFIRWVNLTPYTRKAA